MEIANFENSDEALQAAARALNIALDENQDRPVLLMLSGGSALNLLPYINAGLLGADTTITVLDERFSTDPKINNFSQITKTDFYRKAKERSLNFIDTQVRDGESVEELGERFDSALRDWRKNFPSGKILATIGIGTDGHIAGIMPYPEDPRTFEELFMYDEHWVVSYDAGNKNQYPLRVTPTISFLRDHIDVGIVYVTGEDKKNALDKVFAEQGTLAETPARVAREMKNAIIYTDIQVVF